MVLNQQGILFARLRRFKEAEDSLSRAIDLGIYSDTTWMNRSWMLQEQGRDREALASYQKAIDANRYKEEAYRQRAYLLQHLGSDREAARTWASLGSALLDQGDRRAALFPLMMAKASSKLTDDWGDLEGKVLYLAGEVEAAESLLKRAEELRQLDESWRRRLAGEEESGGRNQGTPAFPG